MIEHHTESVFIGEAGDTVAGVPAGEYMFAIRSTEHGPVIDMGVPASVSDANFGVLVRCSPGAMSVPEEFDREDTVPFRDDHVRSASLEADGAVVIEPGAPNPSGVYSVSVLASRDDAPRPDNTGLLFVNSDRKQEVEYRVTRGRLSRSKVTVTVEAPERCSDIGLVLFRRKGYRPVATGDGEVATYDGREIRFVLGRHERRHEVAFADDGTFRYSLRFEDPRLAEHYVLSDRGDPDMPAVKDVPLKPLCPYCGTAVPAMSPALGRDAVLDCSGKVLCPAAEGRARPLPTKGGVVVCRGRRHGEGGHRLVLPGGYGACPSLNVLLVGSPAAGKTTFLASVAGIRPDGYGRPVPRSPLLTSVVDRFSPGSGGAVAVVPDLVSVDDAGKASSVTDDGLRDEYEKVYGRYSLARGHNIEAYTPVRDEGHLADHPLVFRMGDMGHLSMFDVPGEAYKNRTVVALGRTNAIILLVDGALSPADALNRAVTSLGYLVDKDHEVADRPIAVVLTKLDRRIGDGDGCFDPNVYAVRRDGWTTLSKARYSGELEDLIERSSSEIREFLCGDPRAADHARFLEGFPRLRFFSCSALGSDRVLGNDNGDEKDVENKADCIRLELPLLWLMRTAGMIRR